MSIQKYKVFKGPLIVNDLYCLGLVSLLRKSQLRTQYGLSKRQFYLWKVTKYRGEVKIANEKKCLLATNNLENNIKPDDYFVVTDYKTTNIKLK
jgi:hypothetical protein